MKSKKHLGIWMDHSVAHLMQFADNVIVTNTIESQPTMKSDNQNIKSDESLIQHKEQNHLTDFFKRLSDIIIDYDDVILFGPTDAKNELHNLLRTNHRFEKIKIEIQNADKMTENQQHAFVKDYFKV